VAPPVDFGPAPRVAEPGVRVPVDHSVPANRFRVVVLWWRSFRCPTPGSG